MFGSALLSGETCVTPTTTQSHQRNTSSPLPPIWFVPVRLHISPPCSGRISISRALMQGKEGTRRQGSIPAVCSTQPGALLCFTIVLALQAKPELDGRAISGVYAKPHTLELCFFLSVPVRQIYELRCVLGQNDSGVVRRMRPSSSRRFSIVASIVIARVFV